MDSNDSEEDSEQRSKDEGQQASGGGLGAKIREAIDTVPPAQRRFAEAVVLGLYFLHEAHSDWPQSHGGALFYGALGTCAVLLIELPFKWWLAASSMIAAGCFGVFLMVGTVLEKGETPPIVVYAPANMPSPPATGAVPRAFEGGPGIPFEDAKVRGVLKPANEPAPPNGCDRFPIPADSLKVLIGDNAIFHGGFGAFSAIGIGACDAISMERRADGIFVNASLYDRERQAVVSIRDNRITALSGENYSVRQSRDESRLTVKNSRGTEIFYVRYLNPTTVQFRGFLGCAGGPALHIQESQPIPGFFMSNNCLGAGRGGIQIGQR